MSNDMLAEYEAVSDVMDWIDMVWKKQEQLLSRAQQEGDDEKADRIQLRLDIYDAIWNVCAEARRGENIFATKRSAPMYFEDDDE